MTLTVRPVTPADAPALADLLNAVIAAGGTTALEEPFTPERLDEVYLTGPDVLCCFVAEDGEGTLLGFQTLGRYSSLPDNVGNIATFARLGGTQRGVGSALFGATRARAAELGLSAINATIRADNDGGLAFYERQGFVDHDVTEAVPLNDGSLVDRVHKRFPLSAKPRLSVRPSGEAPALQKKGRGWAISEKRLDTLHERARDMRRHPTPAQAALAQALRDRDTGGYSFKRKDVIGSAIVDFACKPLMLVIELDGDDDADFAATREQSLAAVGYKVAHFPAAEVLADPDGAATRVVEIMRERWHERRAKARPAPRNSGRPAHRTHRS